MGQPFVKWRIALFLPLKSFYNHLRNFLKYMQIWPCGGIWLFCPLLPIVFLPARISDMRFCGALKSSCCKLCRSFNKCNTLGVLLWELKIVNWTIPPSRVIAPSPNSYRHILRNKAASRGRRLMAETVNSPISIADVQNLNGFDEAKVAIGQLLPPGFPKFMKIDRLLFAANLTPTFCLWF